jgi:hypothetical protein
MSNNTIGHDNSRNINNQFPAVGIDNNQQASLGSIDFEIVGLFSSSNGRFCCSHKVCGQHVCVGDVLRLVKDIVDIGDHTEEAIKLVKIIDGTDGCTVGFIPRVQSNLPKVVENINKFCIVHELYCSSNSVYKRKKGEKNQGMAGAILLECIPINE